LDYDDSAERDLFDHCPQIVQSDDTEGARGRHTERSIIARRECGPAFL
jgi:hypothetical protein